MIAKKSIQKTPVESIEQIFGLGTKGVVSFVGGGGKTSLMFHLARHLARSGKKVLTTTTTKIFVPTPDQSQKLLLHAEPDAILRQAQHCIDTAGHITAAMHLYDADKLKGFAPEAIRRFEESGLFDWILVEADGSARRPLKAPAAHEPVVPPNTNHLVAVAGLEVLGAPLSEELVFRSAQASEVMGLTEGETITACTLASLFAHPLGAFKGAPPSARRCIFLNKADDHDRREGAARVAEELCQMSPSVSDVLIVGQALDAIHVHGIYPL